MRGGVGEMWAMMHVDDKATKASLERLTAAQEALNAEFANDPIDNNQLRLAQQELWDARDEVRKYSAPWD